jgi:hypothetical protein
VLFYVRESMIEQRGGSRLRGEMNTDISSISLKITIAAYGGSIYDYEKESKF